MEPRVAGQCELGRRAREATPDPLAVGVLHRDPQLGGRLRLGRGVRLVGADELRVERAELTTASEGLLQRADGERRLLLDVEPGQHEGHRVAPAAEQVDRDLQVGRRRPSRGPRDAHPVGAGLLEVQGVETGDDVGVRIVVPCDLVEELGGHRADRHLAAGARVLGDHRRTVRGHLGDREAGVLEVGHLGEEGVVAAGRLGPALDDVAGDDRAGQGVPVG